MKLEPSLFFHNFWGTFRSLANHNMKQKNIFDACKILLHFIKRICTTIAFFGPFTLSKNQVWTFEHED